MRANHWSLVVPVLCFVSFVLPLFPKDPAKAPACDVFEILGICDPYVPGTIISFPEKQPIIVLSTWPLGPAENAGVCPGDRILAVNGLFVSENTSRRMLKEIVSDSATSVHLTVRRGKEDMELDVPRVRESTLAWLSKQKFVRSGLPGAPAMVPLDETSEEVKQLESFYERIDRRYGFKTVKGLSVPVGTPEEQAEKISKMFQSDRPIRFTGFGDTPDSYSAGFSAVLLKNPDEVWIYIVTPNSPAHRARLFPGDQLIAVDGYKLSGLTTQQLKDLLFKPDEPRQISIEVNRGGSTTILKLEARRLREFTGSNFSDLVSNGRESPGDDYILGIEALHAENPREAIVRYVEYSSPAFDAGLHAGDLLLSINGKPIEQIDREELSKLLFPTRPSEIAIEVSRLGKEVTFRLTPIMYRTALAKIGRKLTKFGPSPRRCPDA